MALGNMIYRICYRIRHDWGTVAGKQTSTFRSTDLDDLRRMVSELNETWGPGTHWIEDETGERIDDAHCLEEGE